MSNPRTTTIKYGELEFVLSKVTPDTALLWFTRFAGDALMATGGFDLQDFAENLPKLGGSFLKAFTRETLAEFVADFRSVIEVRFESGLHPLIGPGGVGFSVPDISPLVLHAVTFQSFLFSMSFFLDQSQLELVMGAAPSHWNKAG